MTTGGIKRIIILVHGDLVRDCAATFSKPLFVDDGHYLVLAQVETHVVFESCGAKAPLFLVKRRPEITGRR